MINYAEYIKCWIITLLSSKNYQCMWLPKKQMSHFPEENTCTTSSQKHFWEGSCVISLMITYNWAFFECPSFPQLWEKFGVTLVYDLFLNQISLQHILHAAYIFDIINRSTPSFSSTTNLLLQWIMWCHFMWLK